MAGDSPSPTEEELEAILRRVETMRHHGVPVLAPEEAMRLIHALRSARESARVATKERDEALRDLELAKAALGHDLWTATLMYRNERELRDEARTTLRAHEETIGRLSHALQNLHDESLLGTEACISCGAKENGSARRRLIKARIAARDALAAAPPGKYEQWVRREALEEAKRIAGTTPVGDSAPAMAMRIVQRLDAAIRDATPAAK